MYFSVQRFLILHWFKIGDYINKDTISNEESTSISSPMKIQLVNWCCSRLGQLVNHTGVEGVETDCKSNKVVVKGEKVDPVKVVERVQRKSHRQVELKQVAKIEEKKQEGEKERPYYMKTS